MMISCHRLVYSTILSQNCDIPLDISHCFHCNNLFTRKNILSTTKVKIGSQLEKNSNSLLKHKASTGSREQQGPSEMALEATGCHYEGSGDTCSCTTNVWNLLFTYSISSTLSKGNQLIQSLTICLAS